MGVRGVHMGTLCLDLLGLQTPEFDAGIVKPSSKQLAIGALLQCLAAALYEGGFQNKNRVAILAELDKEKRKLLMQNQSSTNHPGARPSLNKDFRDHAEQQHIAAQQKAALQLQINSMWIYYYCSVKHYAVGAEKLGDTCLWGGGLGAEAPAPGHQQALSTRSTCGTRGILEHVEV
ncbi:SOSS complex subunit C [Fukomys damarensis]|uniref:SOSS complex subunit C n=1 Tax=Fukomys damarensis TaxID=885580 RepID=A0A091D3T8_FUKDA|nr:SOSS complex subunit C [Fukomys damarensis]